MSVEFDAVSEHNDLFSGSPDTVSWGHTVGSAGSNRILMITFTIRNTSQTVTSVKFAGSEATLVTSLLTPDSERDVYMYYLVSPPIGAGTIEITATGASSNMTAVAASYTGVDADDPLGTFLTDTGLDPSVIITAQDGWRVVDVLGYDAGTQTAHICQGHTVGADQTERGCRGSQGFGGASGSNALSDEPGAASVTMSWTIDDPDYKPAMIAVPLKSAVEYATRPIEYTLDVWDPEQQVLDSLGHSVPRYKIKPNNWCRLVGLESIDARVYESNYDDPNLIYFESVKYDGETDQVEIITSRGNLPEVIMARLVAGSTG